MAEAPAPADVAEAPAPSAEPGEPPAQEYYIWYISDCGFKNRGWFIASDAPNDPNSKWARDMANDGQPWSCNQNGRWGELGPTVVAHCGDNGRTPDKQFDIDLKWGRQGAVKTAGNANRWVPDEGQALPELCIIGTDTGGLVVRGVEGEPWMGFYEIVPDHPHKHCPEESFVLVENRLGKPPAAAVYRWTRPCTDEELAMEKPLPECCCSIS